MQFRIPHDHPSLPGHFPGNPVVPGVVILDRVCAAIEADYGTTAAWRLPQVKFLQPLLPGQEAHIEHVRVEAEGAAPRWRFKVLRADGALLASGEVAAP